MLPPHQRLKIGVVLSGGQAPGGHNVICGLFGNSHFRSKLNQPVHLYVVIRVLILFFFCVLDYLYHRVSGSTLYGFKGGPAGIMKCKYVELTTEYIYPYRNQVYMCVCVCVVFFSASSFWNVIVFVSVNFLGVGELYCLLFTSPLVTL